MLFEISISVLTWSLSDRKEESSLHALVVDVLHNVEMVLPISYSILKLEKSSEDEMSFKMVVSGLGLPLFSDPVFDPKRSKISEAAVSQSEIYRHTVVL